MAGADKLDNPRPSSHMIRSLAELNRLSRGRTIRLVVLLQYDAVNVTITKTQARDLFRKARDVGNDLDGEGAALRCVIHNGDMILYTD